MKKPELLAPAGSLEVLKTALHFGADAVYIGGEAFSLRAKAKNFTSEEMAEGIALAHARGAKVYVTANIFAHNYDLNEAAAYFRELRDIRPDALIVADPGMFALAREVCPEIDLHVSTQANSTNALAFRFWHGQGAKRVVAARELSLAEIRQIREEIPADMEIECFVHGAMCISYSGRCLLSNYFTGRDANRGACTHPCRWNYALMEETRPGEYLPVCEDERGSYIFNAKDLNMIGHIPALLCAGIDSFKIEGRMKTALYVATVTRAYRRAIDDCLASKARYLENLPWCLAETGKSANRGFTTGFYFGKADDSAQTYGGSAYVKECVYLGTVEAVGEPCAGTVAPGAGQTAEAAGGAVGSGAAQEAADGAVAPGAGQIAGAAGGAIALGATQTAEAAGSSVALGAAPETGAAGAPRFPCARFEQRNKFRVGDEIEIMKPGGEDVPARALAMYDETGAPMDSCPHPKRTVYVRLSALPEAGDILRAPGGEILKHDGRAAACPKEIKS